MLAPPFPDRSTVVAAGILVGVLSFGGGLGLLPGDSPPTSPASTPAAAPVAPPTRTGSPLAFFAMAGAALAVLTRRSDPVPGEALGLRPPPEVRVVFIPGHGDRHAVSVYRRLVELMGLDPGSVRYFDYRWVTGHDEHALAARLSSVDAAAWSLNSYLAGVAAEGHPIYLVGFSKGGAALAHLISWWDEGRVGPASAVRGAALLDPPIASGLHGRLQSLGRFWGGIPDDGGYDPMHCSLAGLFCRDRRAHLGEVSGVEVVVVRNPNSRIANFGDAPSGLRIVDAADGGPGPLEQALRNPAALPGRIAEAHRGPLRDPRVARCIVEEMWDPGACRDAAPAGTKLFNKRR